MPPSSPPAIILLSGGLDSAVALAEARAAGFACHALTFDYGQRHAVELHAAARVAAQLNAASHRVATIDLRLFGGSALTDSSIPVPKDRPGLDSSAPHLQKQRTDVGATAQDIPITYVPARNLIFLSFAVAMAEVIGAEDVYIGVNAIDYSGYPDCRPDFIDSFAQCAQLATKVGAQGRKLRVNTPLLRLTKAQIIRRGSQLGVDFSLTHSCYDPSPSGEACGHCDACLLRKAGFRDADVPDVTVYAR